MAPGRAPSEFIEKERKKLLELLQLDPDFVLDTLTSRRLISEDEYEILEKISDPLKKTRKLLIVVQRKGEVSCQHFLQCLFSTFPEFATTWNLKHEFLKYENAQPNQCLKVPIKKIPENPEVTVPFSEKEYGDLETPEYFMDNKTSNMEIAWLSREKTKQYSSAKITLPHSDENIKYKVPAFIEYLQDGQRYEEPDDSLYLGKEEYLKSLGYSGDLETIVEGENYNNPESIISEEQEDSAYSETSGSSDEGPNEKSENKSLEEEEKNTEERKKVFQDILSHLTMDRNRKLLPDIVKQISLERGGRWAPKTPGDLVWNFLIKVQALDVTARDPSFRQKILDEDKEGEMLKEVENLAIQDLQTIDPLDVLCVSLLCSDCSLQREVMSNMYRCKFALPLLLPDAENNKSIFMLDALGAIMKESSEDSVRDSEQFLLLKRMPVISFVRLGYCSFSKSRILNTLLSPTELKPPKVFLHRDLPSVMLPRRISDGLVEVVWCIPGRDPLKENPSFFPSPVAIANLRGDLNSWGTQFGFLMEVSSAVFIFADCLGEKEWNLLLFLENSIERCYFVLGPQARGSEDGQISQRILKLKSSQLLFWEEETREAGKNIEGLQAALQEVMASSLRCVSLEDMALLAREFGIQVDRDFDNVPGIQILPTENLTETVRTEGQPKLSSLKTSAEKPVKEPEVRQEVSPDLHNFHSVDTPHDDNASPLPAVIGGNWNKFSWKDSWVTGSHFWLGQKSKWFCPSPFQHKRDHSRGESLGTKCSQPQRFNSHERFLKFLRTAWGHHMNGIPGKSPRPISQHAQARTERPQSREAFWRPGSGVSQRGQFHSLGTQPIGAVGKPQSKQANTQGTQIIKGTRKSFTASSFNTYPHLQEEAIHNPVTPASSQEDRPNAQSGTSDKAVQMGSHPMSRGNVVTSSQLKSSHPKPSQVKHPQSNPSQLPPHPKLFQAKLTQLQSSQTKCSPPRVTLSKSLHGPASESKPSQPLSFPSVSSQPQSLQSRPQPQFSKAKISQPQSAQSKPSQPQTFPSNSSQSPLKQPKHSQPQFFQLKSSPPQSLQSKPSQLQSLPSKSAKPQPSQSKPSQHQGFQFNPSQPQSSQSKPSRPQSFQPKPSQPQSFQPKPSQPQSFQPKPSQPQSFQPKPSRPQSFQSKTSQPQSFQFNPSQPQSCQSKPSQPQSFQPKPSQSQSFQPKPSQPRTISQSKPSQLQFFAFKTSQPHPSQFKPSQMQYTQSTSSRPQSSQSKISQLHPSPYKLSQASQSKPQHQSSQYKFSHFHSPQSKPSHSYFSQCKPSPHKSAQAKSAWTSPSQAKAHYPRAGPKRIGKH